MVERLLDAPSDHLEALRIRDGALNGPGMLCLGPVRVKRCHCCLGGMTLCLVEQVVQLAEPSAQLPVVERRDGSADGLIQPMKEHTTPFEHGNVTVSETHNCVRSAATTPAW